MQLCIGYIQKKCFRRLLQVKTVLVAKIKKTGWFLAKYHYSLSTIPWRGFNEGHQTFPCICVDVVLFNISNSKLEVYISNGEEEAQDNKLEQFFDLT